MQRRTLVLIVVVSALTLIGSCAGTEERSLGLVEGHLRSCPSSPNCVCSESDGGTAGIAPLAYEGDDSAALARLAEVLAAMPRTAVVTRSDDYMHVTFTSAIFRFVDDVEFRLDREAGVIHVRSASRVGYSDLGANRARVERIREAFAAAGGAR